MDARAIMFHVWWQLQWPSKQNVSGALLVARTLFIYPAMPDLNLVCLVEFCIAYL